MGVEKNPPTPKTSENVRMIPLKIAAKGFCDPSEMKDSSSGWVRWGGGDVSGLFQLRNPVTESQIGFLKWNSPDEHSLPAPACSGWYPVPSYRAGIQCSGLFQLRTPVTESQIGFLKVE